MPTIESKLTGRTEQISISTLEKMKELGLIRRFKVISTDDIQPMAQPTTPIEIREFTEKLDRPMKIYSLEELEGYFVPQLKEIATERMIEFDDKILKSDLINKIFDSNLKDNLNE